MMRKWLKHHKTVRCGNEQREHKNLYEYFIIIKEFYDGNQFSALNQLSKILKSAVEIEFILALLRDESFKNMLNKL